MASKHDDGLFLLEVLVDRVLFLKKPAFPDKDFRTCVSIQCPSVPPLEICDDDSGTMFSESDEPFVKIFDVGKSCLFSLNEHEIRKAMNKFPIKTTVGTNLPCGCLPNKLIVGEATIDMTKEFVEARQNYLTDPSNVSYQALKDSFHILGPDGAESGVVTMFLRISCFGKLIVTRFQGKNAPMSLKTRQDSVERENPEKNCDSVKDFQSPQNVQVGQNVDVYYTTTQPGKTTTTPQQASQQVPQIAPQQAQQPPPTKGKQTACQPDEEHKGHHQRQSSPKAPKVACRNTHEYCLHVPKGALLSLPFYQELSEDAKHSIRTTAKDKLLVQQGGTTNFIVNLLSELENQVISTGKCMGMDSLKLPTAVTKSITSSVANSGISRSTTEPRGWSSDSVNSDNSFEFSSSKSDEQYLFGTKETIVYLTLLNEHRPKSNSETQATASLNKCLQVCRNGQIPMTDVPSVPARVSYSNKHLLDSICYPNVYFFGKKHDENKKNRSGMVCSYTDCRTDSMGCSSRSCKNDHCCTQVRDYYPETTPRPRSSGTSTATNTARTRFAEKPGVFPSSRPRCTVTTYENTYPHLQKQTRSCQTPARISARKFTRATSLERLHRTEREKNPSEQERTKTAHAPKQSAAASTGKPSRSAVCASNKDMVATLSHIKIEPKKPCPIYGTQPCQGPVCMETTTSEGENAPIKISTVSNPRRGVFELVVRRLNGAPLAKNELMLEWTPPQIPSPQNKPKLVMCRPSPCKPICCKPKPCRKVPCPATPRCKAICPSLPCPKCRENPCTKCCKPRPCGSPCGPPCGPPCPSCKSTPCRHCCNKSPCGKPCLPACVPSSVLKACLSCQANCCSSPCARSCIRSCLRPCPVGYGRIRKTCSHPRIRPHKKRTSPCLNRPKLCPSAVCCGVPGPCYSAPGPCPSAPGPCAPRPCCSKPLCPPRKCCSVSRCKPPKCRKSACSTCKPRSCKSACSTICC